MSSHAHDGDRGQAAKNRQQVWRLPWRLQAGGRQADADCGLRAPAVPTGKHCKPGKRQKSSPPDCGLVTQGPRVLGCASGQSLPAPSAEPVQAGRGPYRDLSRVNRCPCGHGRAWLRALSSCVSVSAGSARREHRALTQVYLTRTRSEQLAEEEDLVKPGQVAQAAAVLGVRTWQG